MLLDKADGDEVLALAAYACRIGCGRPARRKVPRYRETQDYVRKVTLAAGEAPAGAPRKLKIYKTLEIIDGRAVPRYSSESPPLAHAKIVSR